MSPKDPSEQAEQYLENLSVEFNDISHKSKSAASLLSTSAKVIRKQREENRKLKQELAALKNEIAQRDATAGVLKKLLSRTADIARTDKSGAVTLRINVMGSLDTAIKLLDHKTETAAKKPPAP